MLEPQPSRGCKVSNELFLDIKATMQMLIPIVRKVLPGASQDCLESLKDLEMDGTSHKIIYAGKDLRLVTDMMMAVNELSKIMSGPVIPNGDDRGLGEWPIGDCVKTLRSLASKVPLDTVGEKTPCEDGQMRDLSLRGLFRRHAVELSTLEGGNPLAVARLPRKS